MSTLYNRYTLSSNEISNITTTANADGTGTSFGIEGEEGLNNESSSTTVVTNSNNEFFLTITLDNPLYLNQIVIDSSGDSDGFKIYTIFLGKTENSSDFETLIDVTSDAGNGDVAYPIPQPNIDPVKYKTVQIKFTKTTGEGGIGFDSTSTVRIDHITLYTLNLNAYSTTDYNVEFDDALLDLAGWKNSRYNGSSLKGSIINTFTEGDISYGLNPVIESKTACIFLGKDIDVGKAANKDNPLTEILDHSYVTIDKILFIDLDTDEIEIVARENLNSQAFNRIVAENFPEGSTLVFKSLEKEANKLKNRHFVKFNQGQLMKLYSYQPNSSGFEDGVFGGINLHEGKGSTDAISLSGSGLFGFGQTVSSSHSLFNTSSIQFSSILPAELSFYAADYATETMGSSLANLTASSAPTLTAGSSINPDDFQEAFNLDDK